VQVDVRLATLDLGGEVEVRRSRQVRVDTTLHADLGGPGLPRLVHPVAHLAQGECVGIGVGTPLCEGAEPAAGVTDVGEVDVARHHEGDVVANRLLTQVVGQPGQGVELRTVRMQQCQRFLVAEAGRVTFGVAQRVADVGSDAFRCG
jgi:hypothetical protein